MTVLNYSINKQKYMELFATGISFRTAPVEMRESLAVALARLAGAGCQLKIHGNLSEVVVVSTCNRVEVYGVAQNPDLIGKLLGLLARTQADLKPYMYVHTGGDVARHLFSVAGGLDSMVLGETEITGQIKNAYEVAQRAGLTGRMTNCLFQKALHAAKAIRTNTRIGCGATSVGSVAVQLAEKIFGTDFKERTVMIIGAGQMGEACMRHLAKKGLRSIIVANRTLEHAEALAREVGGRAVNYMDDGLAVMREADIVISSTGCPETILDREDVEAVMRYRPNRPLFLIDIAVPRDIDTDVQGLENVFLYNIDHFEKLIQANVKMREWEVARCRDIIEKHTAELMTKLNLDSAKVRAKSFPPHGTWVFGPAGANHSEQDQPLGESGPGVENEQVLAVGQENGFKQSKIIKSAMSCPINNKKPER
jgi:glutamyl-tRNA reductase